MARDLDEQVAAFRTRPLDGVPYTFVAADTLVLKVHEGGRVVNVRNGPTMSRTISMNCGPADIFHVSVR